MKKILLLLCTLLTGAAIPTFAGHDIGSSLTYQCVSPNTYLVTYSHYNWGGGLTTPGTVSLSIKSPGCNSGRSIPLQFQNAWQAGVVPVDGVLRSYKVTTLTATVTFTAAEAACKDWVLSSNHNPGGRNVANLTGSNNAIPIYTEATLKLDNSLNNNSPVFDLNNAPILVAARHKPIILSVGASDLDGDSLVYRMVAPQLGPNQPVTNTASSSYPYVKYKEIVYDLPQGQYFLNPNPNPPFSNPLNPQGVHFPGLTNYSADFPLLSYNVDWTTGQQIIPVQKYFKLDSLSGALAFTPRNPGSNQPNEFLVSFQIDEYRKVNGIVTKIGSIRRETVIIIGDLPGNFNPRVSNPRVNNVPVQQNRSFTVGQGSTLSIQLDGSDANAADSVFLRTNAATALPGATYSVTPGQRQIITVNWTPTAAQVRSQPYFLRIWVKDNATPFAGEHVETIALRVSNSGGVMAVKPTLESINFLAFPNPFTEAVSFKLSAQTKAETILIYNLLGQQVDEIPLQDSVSGHQEIKWEKASQSSKGTYLARVIADGKPVQVLKFTKQ